MCRTEDVVVVVEAKGGVELEVGEVVGGWKNGRGKQ